MLLVLPIVAPVFLTIVVGVLAGRTRYLGEGVDRALIEFVFRVSIPALLFRTIVTAPTVDGSPLALYGAFFGAIAIVWIAASVLSGLLLGRPAADQASFALGSAFGNLVLLALPITLRALGPEAATPIAILFLLEFPVMWITATIQHQLAASRGDGANLAKTLRETGGQLIRNPILLAIGAGALWRASGLGLDAVVSDTLELIGRAAAPASLFALGFSLARFKLREDLGAASLIVVLKLVLLPVSAWVLAFHVVPLPPLWAAVVVLFAAMPVGNVAYLFASKVERAVAPVSMAIALSIVISAVTVPVVLYLLGQQPGVVLKGSDGRR